ncbi:nitroreductase [Caulobacter segnis]|uniref:nitroreductase family protein n=1 Tax=Caulobacter segnis TaxID=88688 RepID=UPI002410AA19|nr:nitroreductase [Caulobacter segnis]MDG2522640.1 nitroreductase [Caulobacter segnis]
MRHSIPPAPEFGEPLPIKASPAVLDFLARRRSASAVSLTEPAPDAGQLADILTLSARVPDHGKLAPWRFILLRGEAKAAYAGKLEALAQSRDDTIKKTAALAKLKTPPLAVVVVSSPKAGKIPEWEQVMSAGAVCAQMLLAASAMGFGANWITDWYAFDEEALALLRLTDGEKVAGFLYLGTSAEAPLERVRPDVAALTTEWSV